MVTKGLLKGAKTRKLEFCKHYGIEKQIRFKFGITIHQSKVILEYVHTNTWGQTKTTSLRGSNQFIPFMNDYSRRVWVYPMRHKYKVLDVFLNQKKMIEIQVSIKIKRFRPDNSSEYNADPFMKLHLNEGIVRHFTIR